MELGTIFKESLEVLRKNYVLAIPTVLATFAASFLAMLFVKSPEDIAAIALLGLVGLMLDFFAHGVTLVMAREALEKGQTSLVIGRDAASAFFSRFLVASVAVAVVVGTGLMLLLIPGLAAMLLMMFAFPSMVVRGEGPAAAIKRSYGLVRANLNDSMLLFAVLSGMFLALGILNLALAGIPVAGQFISVVLTGALGGFFSVVLLRAYKVLEAKAGVAAS